MSKASETKNLAVSLNYHDKLSGKAGRTITALNTIDKAAGKTLSSIEAVNKALGRVPALRGRGLLPADRRVRPADDVKARMGGLRVEMQQTRLLREQTKARQEIARLSQIETRTTQTQAVARTRALSDEVRLRRESAKLSQVLARTEQIKSRTSDVGELAGMRLQRERTKLLRDELRLQNDLSRSKRGKFDRFNNAVHRGRNAVYAAEQTFDTVRGFTDPAMRNVRAEERFRIMGFTPEQNRQAFSKVDEVTRGTRGVRRADVVETLSGLINTFGEVEEAIQFLPITSRYRANMEALYGDMYSPQQVTRQISDAFKALELLGIDQPTGARDASGKPTFSDKDRQRMEQYFNIIAQATAATGGEINPNEFRQFVEYMRISGTNISPEGLQKMLPLVQQMGGSQAGTGLMTLYSNLVGGRIPAKKMRYWDELGLLDKSKVEFNKTTGEVQRLLPGAIPVAQSLGTDPVGVADKIAEALTRKGIDVKDKDAVNKQLMAMLGDRTGLGELAQMINFRASIDKEVEKNARAYDIDKTYESSVLKSPLGNYLDLRAQWENTRAQAGRSTAETGGTLAGYLSDALRKLQGSAGQNPAFDMAAVGVLTLGKASAEAADGVGLLDKVTRGVSGGGGGIAGTGADTSDIMAGGWGAWKALKWGGRAGLSALAGASPYLAPLALGGILGSGIYSNYKHDTESRKKAEADAGSQFENVKRLREQHGGRLPDDVAKQFSSKALPGLDRRSLLYSLDLKTYGGPGYPGVSTRPQYDRNAVMAGAFARRAPEFQYPELMRGFIQEINKLVAGGQVTKEGGERTLKVAELAFPESFKQASAEIGHLTGQVTPLTGAFTNLLDPAQRLPGSLMNAQNAAQSFSNRVNALDLTIPLPTFQPFSVPLPPQANAQPPMLGPRIPGSAVGSVVHRDGLVSVHKGNVIAPARLSRRAPGDWLDDFRLRDESSDAVGTPDFSLFRDIARQPSSSGGGVNIESITIAVPPGSQAAADPQSLARLVAAEVARQVTEATSTMQDPDYVASLVAYQVGRESERL